MSSSPEEKPHAVCIPYPLQGHVTPMMKLAKLLHSRGFHVTFVNTEYNHGRLLRSRGPSFLHGLPDFRFETIPDGLPQPDDDDDLDVTQDVPSLCHSIMTTCSAPLHRLLTKLIDPSSGVPPVTCVVSDLTMHFTGDVAEQLHIPEVLLWTASACGLLGYFCYEDLVRRGLTPLKDICSLCDKEFMERPVEGIPGMEGMRFKDFPSFIRTADPDDIMLNFQLCKKARASRASAIVFNTFHDLERPVLDVLAEVLPPIYTLGPLSLLCKAIIPACSVGISLWKEDRSCLQWLQGKPAASVVYVNFGSIAVVTNQQIAEFAWGLAGSGHHFLWVVRPDLAEGDAAVMPEGFAEETKERGMVATWCPQEEVLRHPAVGGFLTHCGWNSTLESICNGVPVACWPFFAEQQTNCRFACTKWGIGVEINGDVRRDEVQVLVRELMGGGERGRKMREETLRWKEKAMAAAAPEGGSSFANVGRLVEALLLRKDVNDVITSTP